MKLQSNMISRFCVAGLLGLTSLVSGLNAQQLNSCSPGAGMSVDNLARKVWSNRFNPTTYTVSSADNSVLVSNMSVLAARADTDLLLSDGNYVYLAGITRGQLIVVAPRISSPGATAGLWDGTGYLWFSRGALNYLAFAPGSGTSGGGYRAVSLYNTGDTINEVISDGTSLWAAGAKQLFRIDYQYTANPAVSDRPVPALKATPLSIKLAVHDMVHDGANLWAIIANSLVKFDSAGRQVLSSSIPATTTMLYDGAYLWLMSDMSATATRIDPGNGQVAGTLSLSGGVASAAFDGRYIWATSSNGTKVAAVYQIRACDGVEAGNFPLANPGSVYFTGSIWSVDTLNKTYSTF